MAPEQAFKLALRRERPGRTAGLTHREREIVGLLGQGLSNREIAEALVIAESTAQRHVANIMAKLQVSSRAQVAIWAVDNGLRHARTSAAHAQSLR